MTEHLKEYQCSWCVKNRFNGDKSCPLPTTNDENADVIKGMNRVINECGCGSFIDTRSHTILEDDYRRAYEDILKKINNIKKFIQENSWTEEFPRHTGDCYPPTESVIYSDVIIELLDESFQHSQNKKGEVI